MTLREIFNGIINFISNLFNKILDFDLTNTLLILFLIFYIVFFVGMVRKSSKFLGTNFKNSNIIKKVGLILTYVFLIFVLVMPFFIAVDVFG